MPVALKTLPIELTAIMQPDGEAFLAVCPELDIAVDGGSSEEAFANLIDAVREYASEYLEDSDLYDRSPNRAHHGCYLRAVAASASDADVRRLFSAP